MKKLRKTWIEPETRYSGREGWYRRKEKDRLSYDATVIIQSMDTPIAYDFNNTKVLQAPFKTRYIVDKPYLILYWQKIKPSLLNEDPYVYIDEYKTLFLSLIFLKKRTLIMNSTCCFNNRLCFIWVKLFLIIYWQK